MKKEKKFAASLSIAIVWLFYLYTYIARVEPSVLINELMTDFNITSSVVGFVVSVMYIPYVIMQVPCGVITDRLGVKTMVALSCAVCSLGTFVFGTANGVLQLEVGRFLVGLSSASAFLCCGKVASEFFDRKNFSMLMGISMFMGCFGGISGTAPIALLVDKIGWRNTTYILSLIGILLLILTITFIPNSKKKEKTDAEDANKILYGLKVVSKNPKAWILGIYGAMSYLPLSAIAELWGIPFMEQRFGIPTEKAAVASIFIFVGFGLGGIVAAWVAERINSYKKTIIITAILMALSFTIAIYNDQISYTTCLVLLFLGGAFAGTDTLCFTLAFELVPKEYSGTSTGFMNMLVMTSGIIFQPLLGKLLDFFRNGLVTDAGEPIYNLVMYRSAFVFVIIAMVVAVISTFFINELKRRA